MTYDFSGNRSMWPGCWRPDFVITTSSPWRRSGHKSSVMLSLNDSMRAGTSPRHLKGPRLLVTRNGAVDQMLTSDGGRVNPRPPPGSGKFHSLPVVGSCTGSLPTDGRLLYDFDAKLSQMSFLIAFVANGLQQLVSSSVTGTRTSLVSALPSRKCGSITFCVISCLNSALFVYFQYASQHFM